MALVTLTSVSNEQRQFDTKHGPKVAFKVWEGDKVGEVTTNPETLDKRRAEFLAIVGKPTELVVQDQGTWDDGSPKPKKMSFPKEQQQGQGGGRRDYVPRWTDTEAGAKWADDRIDRRRALELAVALLGPGPGGKAMGSGVAVSVAERFYSFLQGSADVEPDATVTRSPESVGKAEAGGESPVQGEVLGDSSTPKNPWVTDAQGGEGRDQTGPPAPSDLVDTPEQRKDFRTYLASLYGTADSLMMARTLFQTQVRKIPNLMGLDLEELIAIDTEFKQRKTEVPSG